jgi:alanyl-tRNA synthetase
MCNEWPELKKNEKFILEQLNQEEEKYGIRIADTSTIVGRSAVSFSPSPSPEYLSDEEIGEDLFNLRTTHGLSLKETIKEFKKRDIEISEEALRVYEEKFKKHQELSRTATVGKFKSGLADNSEQVVKYHTATHLLLASLRKILGDHIFQKGSNITAERLRFDFSHSEKLTKEQVQQVEDMVNEQIQKSLPVCCEEMSLEDAKKKNAMGVFESKYGDRVKVYSVGTSDCPYSCEICSGPHVTNTNQLGHFKITKEEASSSGVRRIKAVLE